MTKKNLIQRIGKKKFRKKNQNYKFFQKLIFPYSQNLDFCKNYILLFF